MFLPMTSVASAAASLLSPLAFGRPPHRRWATVPLGVHDKGQIVIRQHPLVTRLEAVSEFSRVQICSEVFKSASHKEKKR